MRYEVELKFRLDELSNIETKLSGLGAVEQSSVSHVDRYFNHPSRDFRSTDEAFRIRSVDDANCVTYKGALIGDVAKTRHEIEVDFANGPDAASKLMEIVRMLGFRFVREVKKTRRSFSLFWSNREYDVSLDDVPQLGQFLEIELIAFDQDRQDAEAAVWKLATQLELLKAEPRSYLNQLLEKDSAQSNA
jgi:adenylate cyclase class 2